MDEESIVTIREELSNDFYTLAETQIEVVRKLLDRLEDYQFDIQLQFESYEQERRRKEAEKQVEKINISNEEQPTKPQSQPDQQTEGVGNEQMEEVGTEQLEGAKAEQQQQQSEQQQQEEPLELLDQSILDILDILDIPVGLTCKALSHGRAIMCYRTRCMESWV